MTNKEAIEILTGCKQYGSSEPEKMRIEYKEAIDLAIKALEFAESQRIGCDNCTNHNRKSKEVCTSPYGQCEFFEDKTQKDGTEE